MINDLGGGVEGHANNLASRVLEHTTTLMNIPRLR